MQTLKQLLSGALVFVGINSRHEDAFAGEDDKELARLGATVYLRCLDQEAAKNLDRRPVRKPFEYEKVAAQACRKQEKNLREALVIGYLQAQLDSKRFANEAANQVMNETIDRTITNLRREMVMVHARLFDERFPGLRGCTVVKGMKADGPDYLCAVSD